MPQLQQWWYYLVYKKISLTVTIPLNETYLGQRQSPNVSFNDGTEGKDA